MVAAVLLVASSATLVRAQTGGTESTASGDMYDTDSPSTVSALAATTVSYVCQDVNGDGRNDIAGVVAGALRWAKNKGSDDEDFQANVAAKEVGNPSCHPWSTSATGDLDGDGFDDVASACGITVAYFKVPAAADDADFQFEQVLVDGTQWPS